MDPQFFAFFLSRLETTYDHHLHTKTPSPIYLTYTRLHAKHWAGMNSSNWDDTIKPDDLQME